MEMTPAEYHRLSFAEKRQHARDQVVAPPMRCGACGAGVQPEDFQGHVRRCSGRPEPHKLDKWIGHREALRLGVKRGTLSYWVTTGKVRTRRTRANPGGRGRRPRRKYLLRDVVFSLAQLPR